jgi:hypothetical protein
MAIANAMAPSITTERSLGFTKRHPSPAGLGEAATGRLQ